VIGNKSIIMTEIKSKEVVVNCSQEEAYNYLINLNNFEHLLPQDKISEFEASSDHCSFKIQNAATIELIKDQTLPHTSIQLKSGEKSPFAFTLEILIKDNGNNTCSGYQIFQGKMNPFIRMVAEKPLAALFNHIADKLVEIKA